MFVDSYKRAIKEMAADNAGMNEILKHCSFKWQELHRDDKNPISKSTNVRLKVELEKYDAKTKLANTGKSNKMICLKRKNIVIQILYENSEYLNGIIFSYTGSKFKPIPV